MHGPRTHLLIQHRLLLLLLRGRGSSGVLDSLDLGVAGSCRVAGFLMGGRQSSVKLSLLPGRQRSEMRRCLREQTHYAVSAKRGTLMHIGANRMPADMHAIP